MSTLESVRHLAVSAEARALCDRIAKFATWEPWDVVEYHDGELPHAVAAYRAAYEGDRDAMLSAMRRHVAEMAGWR